MSKYIDFDIEDYPDEESLDNFYEELEESDRQKDSNIKQKMSRFEGCNEE